MQKFKDSLEDNFKQIHPQELPLHELEICFKQKELFHKQCFGRPRTSINLASEEMVIEIDRWYASRFKNISLAGVS